MIPDTDDARDDLPVLLLVDVSDRDRADPAYGAELRELSDAMAAAASTVGFEVRRVASDTADLGAELAASDAVLLAGGEDVDPALYGGEADYPHRGEIFTDADVAQIALVRAAVESATPLIGICRGLQTINVALGGDLVQHLHESGHVADGPADGDMLSHEVSIDPASQLASIVGATRLAVQTSHHQAVGRPGDGLRVAARADDGTIEAVEHSLAPVWAVQWHPEDRGSAGTVLHDLLAAARAAALDRLARTAAAPAVSAAPAGSPAPAKH